MKERLLLVIVILLTFVSCFLLCKGEVISLFKKFKMKISYENAEIFLGDGWDFIEVEGKKLIFPVENVAILNFFTPYKDSFTLRIKKLKKVNFSKVKIFLNGNPLKMIYRNNKRIYYRIPKNYLKIGKNRIEFTFRNVVDPILIESFKFRNYIYYNKKFLKFLVLFNDSKFLEKKSIFMRILTAILGGVLIFLYFEFGAKECSRWIGSVFDINNRKVLYLALISGICVTSFFFLLALISFFSSYCLIIEPFSFFGIIIGLLTILWAFLIFIEIVKKKYFKSLSKEEVFTIRTFIKSYLLNSRLYFVGAISFLIFCGILLLFNAEKLAENIATIAYMFLVIGVILEVFEYIKTSRKKQIKEEDE